MTLILKKKEYDGPERRMNENGRRQHDQYCSMHQSLTDNVKEIKTGFKWLIGLHIGEYGMIIGILISVIIYLLRSAN